MSRIPALGQKKLLKYAVGQRKIIDGSLENKSNRQSLQCGIISFVGACQLRVDDNKNLESR